MNSTQTLISRNNAFASQFNQEGLSILPKLRNVIITCVDARVDPAHVLGVELGDSVVIRNQGGRMTTEAIEEIATLAFMAAKLDGEKPGPFEVIIMQHTHCGAERYADPEFQKAVKLQLGIDVSEQAIYNHEESVMSDVKKLAASPIVPNYVTVSGLIYDVKTGGVQEVSAPMPLKDIA